MKETIHISMNKELKEQLTEEAHKKGLTLNAYVRMILIAREKALNEVQ